MKRLLALVLLVALAGCDVFGFESDDDPRICTEEFRTYSVEVVGPDGEPASGLAARSVVVATGARLDGPDDAGSREPGTYTVATDADRRAVSKDGSAVRFTAESADLRASADYVFAFDGCHVSRVSGPAQITATRR